jgi:hypothetical protein
LTAVLGPSLQEKGYMGGVPRVPILVVVAVALGSSACLSGDVVPPAVDVTGSWVGQITSTTGPPGYDPNFGEYQMTLDLNQSGANVTGSFHTDISLSGTVSGWVAGWRTQLSLKFAPCSAFSPGPVTLTGTVSEPGATTMAVQYEGTPCGSEDFGTGILTRQ